MAISLVERSDAESDVPCGREPERCSTVRRRLSPRAPIERTDREPPQSTPRTSPFEKAHVELEGERHRARDRCEVGVARIQQVVRLRRDQRARDFEHG